VHRKRQAAERLASAYWDDAGWMFPDEWVAPAIRGETATRGERCVWPQAFPPQCPEMLACEPRAGGKP